MRISVKEISVAVESVRFEILIYQMELGFPSHELNRRTSWMELNRSAWYLCAVNKP